MKIKTKLTYGIGILFILILILGVVAGKYITDMSTDTRNILADNYQSLSYARQMLYSLENIGKDTAAVNVFIDNLRKQQNNITEKDEAEVTTRLMMHFEQFKKDTGQLVVRQLRQDLNDIIQVNMHSIYHKSEIAGRTATNALLWIYVVGIVCVVIALGILMVFPGSITRPIRELMGLWRFLTAITINGYILKIPGNLKKWRLHLIIWLLNCPNTGKVYWRIFSRLKNMSKGLSIVFMSLSWGWMNNGKYCLPTTKLCRC